MNTPASTDRSWWLSAAAALAAVPWPGIQVPSLGLFVLCAVLHILAKPRGSAWFGWATVWAAVVLALVAPKASPPDHDREAALNTHCHGMQVIAEALAVDPDLQNLFAAPGEILDPTMPFKRLGAAVGTAAGRTVYLADDRGLVVAWGGLPRAFPSGVRTLGQRRWIVDWAVDEVRLLLREPVFVDGRLVGSVIVADRSPLLSASAFGMTAPDGRTIRFGEDPSASHLRIAATGVTIPCADRRSPDDRRINTRWWLIFAYAAVAIAARPGLGAAFSLVAGSIFLIAHGTHNTLATAVLILVAGAAVGRAASAVRRPLSLVIVIGGFAVAMFISAFGLPADHGSWIPQRLLQPGWGGIWMLAAAWMAAGLPLSRWSLGRRLALSTTIAALAVGFAIARLPLDLLRDQGNRKPEHRTWTDPGSLHLLPVAPEACDLSGLAPAVARRWHLAESRTPAELRLVDGDGILLSRWGNLDLALDHVELEAVWPMPELGHLVQLEFWRATRPWSLLGDWHDVVSERGTRRSPVGNAVLSRSGEIEATLLDGVRDLPPIAAGRLYHDGGGWAFMQVGDSTRLALFSRNNDRLVASIGLHPQFSELVVRGAIAALWVLFGLAVARAPDFDLGQASTFGGRLRLLVAGGVVCPLAVLTLFLHFRFVSEEERREHAAGAEALHSARYTAAHLSGGFEVDDELAGWLAAGLGGDLALFDHVDATAVSRRDLMIGSVIPELPPSEAFIDFLLGRDRTFVRRFGDSLITAGSVEVQGRRLLLVLSRPEPREDIEAPGIVDWLLSGAALAALFALVLTSRVGNRVSASLRELVALSRHLLDGGPMPDVSRPRETDLAGVLDAVSTMYAAVARREASLRRQEELLSAALSTLASAVMVVERDLTIRFANPAATHLLEENGTIVNEHLRLIGATCLSRNEAIVDTVIPLPGRDTTWRVGAAPAPLPDGARGFVAVVDDVTDVVRIDRLNQLNQMARIVAHEVKNPLTPIRLWVQEITEARRSGDPDIDELVDEACGAISTQVERLQEMANSFSNLAALDRWEPETIDLGELVRDLLAGLEVLQRRGVEIDFDVPAEPQAIVADLQWLRRAVGNVLLNSVSAIGDRPGRVLISLGNRCDEVTLTIEDSGGGVPDSRLEDLFSPHFSTTSSGSGLGLALVHNVVLRCQGTVAAHNGEHGLCVTMTFPEARDPR